MGVSFWVGGEEEEVAHPREDAMSAAPRCCYSSVNTMRERGDCEINTFGVIYISIHIYMLTGGDG